MWFLGSRAQAQRLWGTGLVALRHVDLPGSGVKPVSPALADGFFITEPLGSPASPLFAVILLLNIYRNSMVCLL